MGSGSWGLINRGGLINTKKTLVEMAHDGVCDAREDAESKHIMKS